MHPQETNFHYREPACDWRLSPWPKPAAFRRWRSASEWEPVAAPLTVWMRFPTEVQDAWAHKPRGARSSKRPTQLELALPLDTPRRAFGGIDTYLSTIPEPFRSILVSLPAWHWSILQLLARTQAARDLLLSNPALLVLLTPEALERFLEVRPAVARSTQTRLLPSKQTAALEALGFPPTRAVRRVLQRIPPECCEVGTLLELRRAFQNGVHELLPLTHVRRMNAAVLSLVLDDVARAYVVPSLLLEAAELDTHDPRELPGTRLRDCVLIARTLGRDQLPAPPRTLADLERMHGELVDDLALHQLAVQQREQMRVEARAQARAQAAQAARRRARAVPRAQLELPQESQQRVAPRIEPRVVPRAEPRIAPAAPPALQPDSVEERKLAWKRWEECPPLVSANDWCRFAPPPFAQTDAIRHVPDRRALLALGAYFRNCSVAFAEACMPHERTYAIYYMPVEDVMIGVRRRPSPSGVETWTLDQVQHRGYAPVARELANRIRRWVAKQGGDAGRPFGVRDEQAVAAPRRRRRVDRGGGLPF